MAPPRAQPPRVPPPATPPPRGRQAGGPEGGAAPVPSSSALSTENMAQIQAMIASALLAQSTQHQEDLNAIRSQLATAEARIDDRSALGAAEE